MSGMNEKIEEIMNLFFSLVWSEPAYDGDEDNASLANKLNGYEVQELRGKLKVILEGTQ